MKTLFVLRHAKSSWKDSAIPDHERPLNRRGKRETREMGKLIKDERLLPDYIISSTAKRAHITTDEVVEESGYPGDVRFTRDIYASGAEAYIEVLQTTPNEYQNVMVVGHNPDLEELVQTLTGRDESLTTAALVQISLPIEHWADLNDDTSGEFVKMWVPGEE